MVNLEFENQEIIDFIEGELPSYHKDPLLKAVNADSASMDFYDNLGKELTGEKSTDKLLLKTGPIIDKSSFWYKVKYEVYLFVCTNDEKYEKQRKLLGNNFKDVVTVISTAIASTFTLGTGVVTGIVTNVLISIAKINQNAWCELQRENLNAP